jgi:hypothetical protein
VTAADARLALWATEPADRHHIPPPGAAGVVYETSTFSLVSTSE